MLPSNILTGPNTFLNRKHLVMVIRLILSAYGTHPWSTNASFQEVGRKRKEEEILTLFFDCPFEGEAIESRTTR